MTKRLACLALLLLAGCATQPANRPSLPPPGAPIPPPPPRGEPPAFINLPATRLEAMLGHPAFMRRDGATQLWRYDGAACRAFFLLYGAPLAVRHVETIPHGKTEAADTGCLTALRASSPKTS